MGISKEEQIRATVRRSDTQILCASDDCSTEVTEQYCLEIMNSLQEKHADIAEKRLSYGFLGSLKSVPVLGMLPQIARAGIEILTEDLTDSEFNQTSELYVEGIQTDSFDVYCAECAKEIREENKN